MYHIFFIHSSVNRHLGCFHVLAIVNSATINTGVHVSFQTWFFSRYMPESWIAESHGSSIFSFLRNLQYFIVLCAFLSCEVTSVFTHMKTIDMSFTMKKSTGDPFLHCHFFYLDLFSNDLSKFSLY